jgi:uncharacterized protein (DUF302 family)
MTSNPSDASGPTNGLITVPSAHPAARTLDRLEATLATKGIHVFARIDHSAGATAAGLPLRPTILLIFGNPQAGTPLMQSNQVAGIDLPLKALAWEDDAGRSWLTYNDPGYTADRHRTSDRAQVVAAMRQALQSLAAAATAP